MKNILTLLLVVLGFTSFAQNTQFQRLIGGSDDENSYSIDNSREGGYYLAGYTKTTGAGDKDAYIVKTDGLGEIIWAKAYGESKEDVAWKVKTTGDSGCIMVGTTKSFNNGNQDAFFTKLDKNGNISWTTTLSTDSIEDAYNIALARNGDYLICGFAKTDSFGNDMLVVRLSSTGSVKWLRKLGSKGDEEAFAIAEDRDGNILVAGITSYDTITVGGKNSMPGDIDMLVAKLNDKGNLNWMRTYGTVEKEQAWDIKVDGNKYLVSGFGTPVGGVSNDMYVMSLDTSGVVNFSNSYGTFGDDRAFNLSVFPNSSYVVTGYADPNGGDRDVAVITINSTGRLLKSDLVGSMGQDGHWPTDIVRSTDGGMTILSTSNSYSSTTKNNYYLIRGSSNGDFNCNSRNELFQEVGVSFSSILISHSEQGHKAVSRTFKVKTDKPSLDSTLCCKLDADVIANTTICKGEKKSIGGANIQGYTYSWTASNSNWTSSEANPSVSPTKNTTYKLVVSAKNGICKKDSAEVTITVQDILTDDFVKNTYFCTGGSVKLKIRSDLSSYAWNGTHVTSTDSNITVTKGDTIYVTLFDKNGCGYLDTAIVLELALPEINLGNDTTICDNLPITLSGPKDMKSYNWNSGEGTKQTFTTNKQQTHKLTVVDSFGCTSSEEIKILSNPHSTFTLGPDTSFCTGSSFTILGPGALGNYIWNDTASTQQNIKIRKAGTYHLTAENSFGCPYSDTIVITEWAVPQFSLGADFILCSGTSKILTGPAGMKNYLWSTGKNTESDTIKSAGTIFLIATDNNGCQGTDTVIATSKSNPIPDLGNDTTICHVDTITIGTARTYVEYDWNTGAKTQTIRITNKGTYTVTVTDTNGCKGTGSMDLDTTHCVGSVAPILTGSLKVYPNPASSSINLQVKDYLSNEELQFRLLDMNGKVVLNKKYPARSYIEDEINISSVPSGVYLIHISNNTGVKQLRLLVE